MNLSWIDWSIVGAVLLIMTIPAIRAARHCTGVSTFLAANRIGDKYLLTVSQGSTGAVGTIAVWQMIFNVGLSSQWWGLMSLPIGLFIRLTGFVTYRFRETRALTLAQFLEMRYSRGFRLFSGSLCWLSGMINYGVFPAVSSQAIVTLMGLNPVTNICGREIPTNVFIMMIYLTFAIIIACSGGQISLMISDFLQESFCKVILISLTVFLLMRYSWPNVFEGLEAASKPGISLFDPYDTSKVKGFNVWYFLIGVYGSLYSVMAWQGGSGYNAAAKTPHEAQMAGILGTWRDLLRQVTQILPPVIALVVLHSGLPEFSADAAAINEKLSVISDPQVRNQMMTPMFLRHVLPVGMIGMLVAMFVSGVISVDDTYIHSWGSIFIQDVVMPWKKKPFTPRVHMLLLRLSIIGVAIFGFLFSVFFPFKDAILMFFALSGAIYLGGAGITIIGGLYWKRGTTAAAFVALATGSVLAFGGILLEQMWTKGVAKFLLNHFPQNEFLLAHADKFPLSGQIIYFIAMVTATLCYIIISLLTCRKPFNLDRMLHRGEYADNETARRLAEAPKTFKEKLTRKLGITKSFKLSDKLIYGATLTWSMGKWLIFIVICLIVLFFGRLSAKFWSGFWYWYIFIAVILGIVCTIWLTSGGFIAFFKMMKELKTTKTDDADDGFVAEKKGDN